MNKAIIARKKRLSEGRCPIHGLIMYQIGLEEIETYCDSCEQNHTQLGRHIVQCTRKDCHITCYEIQPYADAELFPKFIYLLKE